jgi:RimJ/RimL family protein N-acetyltransferase
MLAVLDRGRARGFKQAQITPSAGNEASVKAYKKVGFQGTVPLVPQSKQVLGGTEH